MYYFSSLFLFGFINCFRFGSRNIGSSKGSYHYCLGGDIPDIISNGLNDSSNNKTVPDEILMLPSSSLKDALNKDGEIYREINLGETISLEELGPIIINTDGTTRRITNWSGLSKSEQDTSFKVIAARNLRRLKVLQRKIKLDNSEHPLSSASDDDDL